MYLGSLPSPERRCLLAARASTKPYSVKSSPFLFTKYYNSKARFAAKLNLTALRLWLYFLLHLQSTSLGQTHANDSIAAAQGTVTVCYTSRYTHICWMYSC